MPRFPLPSSVAIIGAGASGLFAARRLRQLGVKQITLIEKEDEVGGKCSTYYDPNHTNLIAERGAMLVAPHNTKVIEILKEKKIQSEPTLSIGVKNLEFIYRMKDLSLFKKLGFCLRFLMQIVRFNRLVFLYRKCCKAGQMLPTELEEPFCEYAKKHHLDDIEAFLQPFVVGFGYGHYCPTYSVLEYMGYMTIPFLIGHYYEYPLCALRGIHGGFQHVMKKMAEDFQVYTSAVITSLTRDQAGCSINFTDAAGQHQSLRAEALILALSPKHWSGLLGPENLTGMESACVKSVSCCRYLVVICRLHGLAPKHYYSSTNRYGSVSLITTSDQRKDPADGRLCSAYVTLSGGSGHPSEPDMDSIIADLQTFPSVTKVEIVEYKIWEDYCSILPWNLRLKLDNAQYLNRTLYMGGYTLGSFESTSSVARSSMAIISKCFQ